MEIWMRTKAKSIGVVERTDPMDPHDAPMATKNTDIRALPAAREPRFEYQAMNLPNVRDL